MHPLHTMHSIAEDRGGVTFACPEAGCGRRLRISRTGDFTVLDKGDPDARHTGGTGSLVVDLQADQEL